MSRVVAVAAVWKFAVNAGGMRLTMTIIAGCDSGMLVNVAVHTGCRTMFCRGCLQLVKSGVMTGCAQIIGGRSRVFKQRRLMCGVTGGAVGGRHFG